MSHHPGEVVFPLLAQPVPETPSLSSLPSTSAEGGEMSGFFSYQDGPVKVPGPWKRGRPKCTKTKANKTRLKAIGKVDRSCPPSLEFINLDSKTNDFDKSTKVRIRSHARRNRKPLKVISRQNGPRTQNTFADVEAIRQKARFLIERYHNLHQIPGVDPFASLPMQLEPYMHDLIVFYCTTTWKRHYTLERAAAYNPFSEYWLPFAFSDAAVLHTFIGCADAFITYFTREGDGVRTFFHLNRAISIVSRRLQEITSAAAMGKSEITSGTLVMVAGLAMFERSNGRQDHWKMHMQGLCQLVRHFGGIDNLYSQSYILQKICRADLSGSLEDDEPPYFDGHRIFRRITEIQLPSNQITLQRECSVFHSPGFDSLSQKFIICSGLCFLLRELEDVTMCWAASGGFEASDVEAVSLQAVAQRRMETVFHHLDKRPTVATALHVRRQLVGIQYALVSAELRQELNSMVDVHDRHLSELCRLGLILFTLTILDERAVDIPCNVKLITKVRKTALLEKETTPEGLRLWCLFLAASVTKNRNLLLDEIRRSGYSLHSDGVYNQLHARMSRYLWVPCVHDKLLQIVWSGTAAETSAAVTEIP